ncbi:MAG: TRAP transporter small permease [Chloroflexota bacterium]|jgi:TRAP-type C4-dicarboxylate transport system permease small subunit
MKQLTRALNWLDENLEYWLQFGLYMYCALIIVVEVIRRYFFHSASAWGEETALYAFVWMSYVAMARGVKKRAHLCVDLFRVRMNRTQLFCSFLLGDVCFIILATAVIYYSFPMLEMNIRYDQQMLGIELPMILATAAIPVAWSLVLFRVIQRMATTIAAYRRGDSITLQTEVSE